MGTVSESTLKMAKKASDTVDHFLFFASDTLSRPTFSRPEQVSRELLASTGEESEPLKIHLWDLWGKCVEDIVPALLETKRIVSALDVLSIGGVCSQDWPRLLKAIERFMPIFQELSLVQVDCASPDIFPALGGLSSLHTLRLLKCNLGVESVYLSAQLKNLKNLTELDLSRNNMGDLALQSLLEGIEQLANLQSLSLKRNRIGFHGMRSLAQTLKLMGRISKLDVSQNPLGDKGIGHFVHFAKSSMLESILLDSTNLGAEGLEELAPLLNTLKNLRAISFGGNGKDYNPFFVLLKKPFLKTDDKFRRTFCEYISECTIHFKILKQTISCGQRVVFFFFCSVCFLEALPAKSKKDKTFWLFWALLRAIILLTAAIVPVP